MQQEGDTSRRRQSASRNLYPLLSRSTRARTRDLSIVNGGSVGAVSGNNDHCATARRLTLIDGRLELTDETVSATDEHAALDCGSRGTADTLIGPQRDYMIAVRRGQTYRFQLTPSFHAVLYGFDSAIGCTADAIQRACRSRGADGFASDLVNPGTGKPGATVFGVPPPFRADRDMDLVFAVDSDGGSGRFVLTITEQE